MSQPIATGSLTGVRAGVDQAFRWGLRLFLLAVVVQFFLAGLGVFDTDGRELEDATSLDPHRSLGFALGGAAILLLILSLIVRANARTMLLTLVLAVLAFIAQSVLSSAGESTAFWGGLHALDGLLILGLASFLHTEADRRNRTRAPSTGQSG